MLNLSYALIIGPLLFLLMSSVAGGEWERTIGVCKGITVKKYTLAIVFPEPLCFDVDTSSVFRICGLTFHL